MIYHQHYMYPHHQDLNLNQQIDYFHATDNGFALQLFTRNYHNTISSLISLSHIRIALPYPNLCCLRNNRVNFKLNLFLQIHITITYIKNSSIFISSVISIYFSVTTMMALEQLIQSKLSATRPTNRTLTGQPFGKQIKAHLFDIYQQVEVILLQMGIIHVHDRQ